MINDTVVLACRSTSLESRAPVGNTVGTAKIENPLAIALLDRAEDLEPSLRRFPWFS